MKLGWEAMGSGVMCEGSPYRVRDALGANILHTDKVFVYEAIRSSGVQKCLDGMHLTGVSSADLDRKSDRCSMGIEDVGRELFGKSLFPFWLLRQSFPFWSGREGCDYRFIDVCIDFFYVQYNKSIY